ncbi:methionine synthase (B12-independent) [Saccharopolyspora erythraea NRRL 2338]|uniref:5-methyltetrahydropteroyltriglutamate--homocysteine methyltransferase n=1 Tax=Saccharopolyspora erythraea (strain ATCC 11635 / DSM 40517 / JCM 4748 / NBRC 13426 / NCIMB 8594 / NRRL 2338) TaxID=405948 RepID=A4FN94_SACEN|nr:5-methyltetrahydropteroyltriglutamate--homocysteine S-methyltransferase [Saccharopolyspora erythraea]EQD82384.1 5-methyltetrahydropteroyltriglutamate--homocysteine methyltransferase [Saccharopolyspora erythraea D]PFG99159.1 methionine synthase (B12-independent) [Saccharopolyspora erythraea NRRL 2338]QRK89111.1 5-methyltetrahydropteroyltriglutamate--homocysteine S-methyltransferase [Saccharopolyspora erythraea]CAM05519.1 5-methyltetrahydropteroyltriglutamate--homocysteine methyltransferase [S
MSSRIGSTVLGHPRIGPRRELKRALEGYWASRSTEAELREVARSLRAGTWRELAAAGLDSVPGNTFSYYDQVLDTAATFGAVPRRFAELGLGPLDTYFAMARGVESTPPLEMTKWFDTNYHYLVPEIGPGTTFSLADRTAVEDYREAAADGVGTRPVVVGPLTFLLLSKSAEDAPKSFRPLDKLDELVQRYAELLTELHDAGAGWVQLDEPAFAADRTPEELELLRGAYRTLSQLDRRPDILVATYFGDPGDALPTLASTDVEGIAVDLVSNASTVDSLARVDGLRSKTLVSGLVDGRNVWRTDLDAALGTAAALLEVAGEVAVSTSCSLLHVPYDVDAEANLDPHVRPWLAFAKQKAAEVVTLGRALREGRDSVADELAAARNAVQDRRSSERLRDNRVRGRLDALSADSYRRSPYDARRAAQRRTLDLPPLPTTTIGSFPQTPDVRKARAALRNGSIDQAAYDQRMLEEISRVIALQEALGLDVLVHGEPERNDMVQYFAEHLDGFVSTENGWVQSYGSRCVRPPILFGDVSRPEPITTRWAERAQRLTEKPVKGMLTGPITILAWSFVRDDQPLGETAAQVALAIRDEVRDLEAAGIRVIQVDEPALRELLPLRAEQHEDYLDWAVGSFRLATSGVADRTQVHTHLCYSEFGEVIDAIVALDADVTSIEAARSRMEVLDDLNAVGFGRGVGPGVYDIHSPRVPSTEEIEGLLAAALRSVPAERLWVNPDCGLKTRGYAEVEPALRSMVEAAARMRADLA